MADEVLALLILKLPLMEHLNMKKEYVFSID